MEKKEVSNLDTRTEPLASEIYGDLKQDMKFFKILTVILVTALLIQGLYHNWRWSQFDRVSVDSSSGPASYVQGENTGGVYFGTSSSPSEEGRTVQGDAD